MRIKHGEKEYAFCVDMVFPVFLCFCSSQFGLLRDMCGFNFAFSRCRCRCFCFEASLVATRLSFETAPTCAADLQEHGWLKLLNVRSVTYRFDDKIKVNSFLLPFLFELNSWQANFSVVNCHAALQSKESTLLFGEAETQVFHWILRLCFNHTVYH